MSSRKFEFETRSNNWEKKNTLGACFWKLPKTIRARKAVIFNSFTKVRYKIEKYIGKFCLKSQLQLQENRLDKYFLGPKPFQEFKKRTSDMRKVMIYESLAP